VNKGKKRKSRIGVFLPASTLKHKPRKAEGRPHARQCEGDRAQAGQEAVLGVQRHPIYYLAPHREEDVEHKTEQVVRVRLAHAPHLGRIAPMLKDPHQPVVTGTKTLG
jgi:hypothetical protein